MGCIGIIKVVFITIHTHHLGSYTGEHRIWMLSSTPSLSTCTVYTHFLSTAKSLPDWGNSPRSPSLQRKDQAHFVRCWLNECQIQLPLCRCPYAKGKTMLLKGRSSWESDLHFSEDILFQLQKENQTGPV